MTRITLEEPRAAAYPVVKRTALGQTFNGAVLKAESRDRMKRGDDGSMKPIVKPNGKHAQEMVVTCLTLPGTTSPAGLGDEESVPEPGAIVRLILKGKAFGDWIEGKRALPDGSIAVGDLVTQVTSVAQVYDAQGNPSGGEITDQSGVDQARIKGRSVGVYGPLTLRLADEASEWTTKAIAAYRQLETAVAAAEPAGGGYDSDDAPDWAAPATPEPAVALNKPSGITDEAWANMPPEVKKQLVSAMGDIPF